MKPTELGEEIAIELEALKATANELAALHHDVAHEDHPRGDHRLDLVPCTKYKPGNRFLLALWTARPKELAKLPDQAEIKLMAPRLFGGLVVER